MSLISITNQQRYDIGYRANIAANLTQRFVNNTKTLTAEQAAPIDAAITQLMTALEAAGYTSVPEGSAIVADGAATTVVNANGTVQKAATFDVNGETVTVALPATVGMKSNNDSISVQNVNGAAGVTSTSYVDSNGVLVAARLPATTAVIASGNNIQIRNSAGTAIGNATFTVSNGVITYGTLPATIAGVANGATLTGVAPTGTYTNTVTFTVAGGVITGIALS
ncbi:hypothetical protein [Escherichia phage J8-65]|uniref:Uncharacterized protein n=1 Tax=Escherichia phage J8-65 TaxID=1536597 RepID=A0A088F6K9_9CAUD|nr:hypothetical protein PI28_gp43 [Escherichia phage J8-65]AIM40545.1 hypothetical protein [Escherichia phage J8-65]